jgi:sugar lactone lactonase YvrE
MPGIAVDDKDNIWIYTRAVPPVQVYDADGRFLRAWGEDVVKTAHHIRFDAGGNVWLADIGHHVVMQLTPEGKLRKTLGTSTRRAGS